jgi:predicted lipase
MINKQTLIDIVGLPMLVYDYVKKIELEPNETIEQFVNSIDNSTEMNTLTKPRLEALKYIKNNSPNGKVVKFINDKESDLQVGITTSEKNKRITVVFRGSESIVDWIYDFMVCKIKLDNKIYVHSGFYNQLQRHDNYINIKNVIENILTSPEKKDYEIYITGHSLGGALATLFGYLYSKETERQIKIISFASPRVGNIHFKNDFDNQPNLIHYRITNHRDIVTATPMIFYKHVGINIHLTNQGNVEIYKNYEYNTLMFSLFRCWNVFDHSVDLYYQRIKDSFWNDDDNENISNQII